MGKYWGMGIGWVIIKVLGVFYFIRNFENFEIGINSMEINFLGMFLENLEMFEFFKYELFNWNF